MKVKDLYLVQVKGKMIVEDREHETICEVNTGGCAREIYKTLRENEVLEEEINYIEIIKDTMYITIK